MTMWIYKTNENNTMCFSIGVHGKRPLICIGVNPGNVEPGRMNAVTKTIEGIAKNNGYDGWIMLNVYPKRDNYFEHANEKGEHRAHIQNIKTIRMILEEQDSQGEIPIWAAWGEQIYSRDFLIPYLKDIYLLTKEFENVKWYSIGLNKAGIPKNPLYQVSNAKLEELDMNFYMKDL